MARILSVLFLIFTLVSTVLSADLSSGIDLDNFDKSVRPQDNFYNYANGGWLAKTEIPGDKASYGSFHILFDENQKRLRKIIEDCAAGDNEEGTAQQKIGDYYNSYMDTVLIEELGIEPIKSELKVINSIKKRDHLVCLMAHLKKIGVGLPIGSHVEQDLKDAARYALYISQGGTGLPDRDYYLKEGEPFDTFKKKYIEYITKMLDLAGEDDADEKAEKIMEIEYELAENQWTRVENRDRDKTYNKYLIKDIDQLMTEFDFAKYLKKIGVKNTDYVIVKQPSFIQAVDKIIAKYSIDDWKAYYTFRFLQAYAGYLTKEFVDAQFEFYSKTLSGIQKDRPRWKKAVGSVNGTLGEEVGKVYVAEYFKPAAKARMMELVENLRTAFAERIKDLEWMGEETKKQALHKLQKFTPKIGYPDKWRDYSGLVIRKDELLKNSIRSNRFDYDFDISKLGKPIDKSEWFMTPQSVNAYYYAPLNEIVFPAAILQPPFFNMEADDAVNYGAIGAVIGHEMSHGFDDQGSKSDADGNMNNWWTDEDKMEFEKRGEVLVDQFNNFKVLDTVAVNGKLTLGENIGDLGGLAISLHAYKNSLNGEEAPVIDGLTGTQRFFLGWAQVWRGKYRDEALRQQVMTDPHSPALYRVNGSMVHLQDFYDAFDIKEGDPMYVPAAKRAKIW